MILSIVCLAAAACPDVVVISGREDRLKAFSVQAAAENITYEVQPALMNQFPQKLVRSKQRGCSLSHFLAWNKLRYTGGIIFEDDITIKPGFWSKFNRAAKELPRNWDMLIFSGPTFVGEYWSQHLKIPHKSGENWGSYAYMISYSFVKTLIQRFTIKVPIDQYLRDSFYYNSRFKVFITTDTLIEHTYAFGSNIRPRKH